MGEGRGEVAFERTALVFCEDRSKRTGTWPYDVTMLRALLVSVLVPAAAAVGKTVVEKAVR
jgi:hypothetical protein